MGYNLYIPVYLQEKLGLSPLQSGLVIFPLSVAWITLNFNLAKIEAHFTRKALYISAFTILLICSIVIIFGLKVPLLIAFAVILRDSVLALYILKIALSSKKRVHQKYEKMMSFYALTKNLGSSIGSTLMGSLYALQFGLLGGNFYNILTVSTIVALILILMWVFLFEENKEGIK